MTKVENELPRYHGNGETDTKSKDMFMLIVSSRPNEVFWDMIFPRYPILAQRSIAYII